MNPTIMNKVIKAVEHAKEKHPNFCDNNYQAISIATEELGELAKAMNDGNAEEVIAEALDVIAVMVRIIERFDFVPYYSFNICDYETLAKAVASGLKKGE